LDVCANLVAGDLEGVADALDRAMTAAGCAEKGASFALEDHPRRL